MDTLKKKEQKGNSGFTIQLCDFRQDGKIL